MLSFAFGALLGAQPAPAAPAQTVDLDPIRCWWRTSAGAVRVGEPFSLVLTCAVVENATMTVVPDQSPLEPSAIQLPPFEVIGGERQPDLHSDQRRFFQYQYQLRLISSDLFGKDARIPSVQVTYHVESRVERGESVRGRDRTYLLPSASVRVLSLVPSDAADIRDMPTWTFSDIEAQRFRARVLFVVAALLFAGGALVVLVALVRLVRRGREASKVGRRLLGDRAILRGAARELRAVGRSSDAGWNPDLIGRALAALRIGATLGMAGRASQMAASPGGEAVHGALLLRGGWLRGKKVLVSGSATAAALDGALASDVAGSAKHREALSALQSAIGLFTAAQFGREPALEAGPLGQAVLDGSNALRRLQFENIWMMRKLKRLTVWGAELRERAWSR
jgi:hypothetical protein